MKTGLRPETISRIESSHSEARVDTLGRLAKALDVGVEWILRGDQKIGAPKAESRRPKGKHE